MKYLEILLGLFLWAIIIIGMAGASLIFGLIMYTAFK